MKSLVRWFSLLFLSLAACPAALGQSPATQPAARLSAASVNAFNNLVSDYHLPFPDLRRWIESNIAFLSNDSLALSRPIGLVILSSDDLPDIRSPQGINDLVMVLPVVEGRATRAAFTGGGATPVPGEPDVLYLRPYNIRRTANYLLLQIGKPLGISLVPEDVLAADFKDKDNLLVLSVDFAAVRKAAPQAYKAFVNELSAPPPPGDAQALSRQLFLRSLVTSFNRLDRLQISLGETPQDLHLKAAMAPFGNAQDAAAPRSLPRPIFPPGAIAQIHVIYPDASWSLWLQNIFSNLPAAAFPRMNQDQVARIRELTARWARLYTGGQALSLALAFKNGKPLVYLVSQSGQPVDYQGEIKAISQSIDSLNQDTGDPHKTDISTYSSAGKTITRWIIPSQENRIVIDAIQTGNVLYATLAGDDGKYLDDLAAIGMGAETSALCAGSVDLGELYKAAMELHVLSGTPDEMDKLAKVVAGQSFTWTVRNTQGELNIDLQINKQVLQDIIKLMFTRG